MGFAISDLDKRWPHARVPYLIDEQQFPPGLAAHRGILGVFDYYRYQTGIQFLPRIDEADFAQLRRVADRSNAEVGLKGGEQEVNCSVDDLKFASGSKITYPERSDDGPALAFFGGDCFMAWRGTDDRLNLARLDATGNLVAKRTLVQSTVSRPALIVYLGRLILAYREPFGDALRLLQGEPIGIAGVPGRFKQLLRTPRGGPSTGQAPALCVHAGLPYLAWTGTVDQRLNLAVISGRRVHPYPILADTSESGPAVASFDGRLYLAWRGLDDRLNVMRSDDDGKSFVEKTTSPIEIDDSPALAEINRDLYIAWKHGEQLMAGKVQTSARALGVPLDRVWTQAYFEEDTSAAAPALAGNGTAGRLGWKGAGNQNLNTEPTGFSDQTPLIHESAHLLGLHHEQQRPDRDAFVTMSGPQDEEWTTNYAVIEGASLLGRYDCVSLMHYRAVPGRMMPAPGGCPSIGPGALLSPGDIDALRYMYPITRIQVLDAATEAQPALSASDGGLMLAWRGAGNENLNTAGVQLLHEDFAAMSVSSQALPALRRFFPGGIETLATYGDTSDIGPALAGANLVWKGSGNEDLNFGYVGGGNLLANKTLLRSAGGTELSDHSPAALPLGPHIAIAWKGHGNDSLNLVIVDSNGQPVSAKRRFADEATETAPALCLHGDVLMLAWKGSGNNALNLAPVAIAPDYSILGLGPRTTLPVGCDEDTGPSLASLRGALVIAWKGESNEYLHFMLSFDDGASFVNLHASAEKSSHAPSLATLRRDGDELLLVAWKGAGNDNISLGTVNLAGL